MWRTSNGLLPAALGITLGLGAQALPPLSESEGILVRPMLDRKALGEDLLAIPSGGKVFLPLGELCRLLAFDITVRPGSASGSFLATRRPFRLDLATRSVSIAGQTSTFPPEQVRALNDELYLDAELLGAWFPLKLSVDLKDAVVLVAPQEGTRLPIQELWEREGRYAQFNQPGQTQGSKALKGTRVAVPYAFFDIPTADLSAGWSTGSGGGQREPQATATLSGDLLWMSSLIRVVRDPVMGFRNSRGTLFREDPDGGLLGPLHARRMEFGDLLQSGSLELVGGLPTGRGFSLNNRPLDYRTTFGNRAFRGELPQGWTVELYQNGTLMGFCRSRADGRYEFPEVPLRFGMNDFALVFLGPFGQRREESYRLDIAGDQPPPGSFFYQIAAASPRQDVAIVGLNGVQPAPQGTAGLGSLEYGVTPTFSLKAGGAQMSLPDGTHCYAVAGFRSVLPYIALDLTGARDSAPQGTQANAFQGLLRTGWGYSSLSLRRAVYQSGFQNPSTAISTTNNALKDETQADLNASTLLGRRTLSLGGSLWAQNYQDGERRLRGRVQAGLGFQSVSLAAFVGQSRWAGQDQRELGLSASARHGGFGFQGEVQNQRQGPTTQGLTWNLNGDYQGSSGFNYRAALQKVAPDSNAIVAQAGVARLMGAFGFGADGTWSRGGGWSLTLRLQLSLQREPRTGQWTSSAQSLGASGSLSAQAYLDDNRNGRKDPGERVLEGTRFTLRDGAQLDNQSKDPRVAWYTQLGRSQWVPVAVDGASLEDLSLQPAEEGRLVLPRPGKVIRLDLPVQILGEVNGTTRRRLGTKVKDLGGLEVEVASADRSVVRRIRTAFDGFFEIRNLPPGSYTLSVPPEEAKRLDLRNRPTRSFTIDASHTVHDGQDLLVELPTLEDEPPPQSPSEAKPSSPLPPGGLP